MKRLFPAKKNGGSSLLISMGVLIVLSVVVFTAVYRQITQSKLSSADRIVAEELEFKKTFVNEVALKFHQYAVGGNPINALIGGCNLPTDSFRSWYSDSYQGTPFTVSACDNTDSNAAYDVDTDQTLWFKIVANFKLRPKTFYALIPANGPSPSPTPIGSPCASSTPLVPTPTPDPKVTPDPKATPTAEAFESPKAGVTPTASKTPLSAYVFSPTKPNTINVSPGIKIIVDVASLDPCYTPVPSTPTPTPTATPTLTPTPTATPTPAPSSTPSPSPTCAPGNESRVINTAGFCTANSCPSGSDICFLYDRQNTWVFPEDPGYCEDVGMELFKSCSLSTVTIPSIKKNTDPSMFCGCPNAPPGCPGTITFVPSAKCAAVGCVNNITLNYSPQWWQTCGCYCAQPYGVGEGYNCSSNATVTTYGDFQAWACLGANGEMITNYNF